uniref:YegS/Rv2252/BmrU family lipid kinase n=1 Tax=candidate division WOR-3 bacterium TaxID=2052148 RepID=A0A7V0Z4N0_UNCW3
MFHKAKVIINASAGAYLAGRKLKKIQNYLKDSGCEPYISETQYQSHAKELAIEGVKDNFDLIISVGGDGTINEIINGIMEAKNFSHKLPALGIISAETGADLCRTLNIPFDYKKAIEIILKGNLTPIDIGVIKFKLREQSRNRYFANVIDAGLGGNVVRIANHIPKRFGGFLTFLLSSLAGIIVFQRIYLKIYIDGINKDEGKINIIGAANGKYFGGGMKIAPMACINDGYLEVLYVKETNTFKFIKNVLIPVYDAKHLFYKNLYHLHAQKLKIVSNKVFPVDIDGEEEKAEEIEISIMPRALNIVTPSSNT